MPPPECPPGATEATRQEKDKTDHDDAEEAGMKLQQVAPDQLFHEKKQERAIDRPQHGASSAEQNHDNRLHRQKNVVNVGRVDIVDPRGVNGAT